MNIRISKIIENTTSEGHGMRLAIYLQGCTFHCDGCNVPETWKLDSGGIISVNQLLKVYKPHFKGITLTGGEPFLQSSPLITLVDQVHTLGGDAWCYTGFTLEQLKTNGLPQQIALLNEIDVLIDGIFDITQRDMSLLYRGSKNQRIWIHENNNWKIHHDLEVFT